MLTVKIHQCSFKSLERRVSLRRFESQRVQGQGRDERNKGVLMLPLCCLNFRLLFCLWLTITAISPDQYMGSAAAQKPCSAQCKTRAYGGEGIYGYLSRPYFAPEGILSWSLADPTWPLHTATRVGIGISPRSCTTK